MVALEWTAEKPTPAQTPDAGGHAPIRPAEYPAGSRWVLLSREEDELIRIYRALNIRDCHKLMEHAFRLERGDEDGAVKKDKN